MNYSNIREKFLDQGYYVIKNCFDVEKIKGLRDNFIKISNSDNEILTYENAQELLLDERLISKVKQLLDTEKIIYFSDSSIINKPDPLTSKNGWHNDARFEDENISYNDEYPILRIGIYFEDHKNYSGGLKIKKNSHKYFCFNWRAKKENIKKLLKIIFTKTRYRLSSIRPGKGINLDLEQGDVVVWNLRTHHCGVSRRLKIFPDLCLHPYFEKMLPLFLFKKTHYTSDRCTLFSTFAKNDMNNKNINNYVLNKMNIKKIEKIRENKILVKKLDNLGILTPNI